MHLTVRIFLAIWLGLTGITAVISVIALLYAIVAPKLSTETLPVLIPILMFSFGVGLSYGGYTYERRKAIAYLKERLSAEIQDQLS